MMERLTKAEIIELLKKEKAEKEALIAAQEAREKQVDIDLSFGATPKERTEQQKAQAEKDRALRGSNWRFTSEHSRKVSTDPIYRERFLAEAEKRRRESINGK